MAETASIVLIDDDRKLLGDFSNQLSNVLRTNEVEIRTWIPTADDEPFERLNEVVDTATALVVTDYDLTGNGLTGLFGATIVGWCQSAAIPVGDFSRGTPTRLPEVPNLFELRVPTELDAAAEYTASTALGFIELRAKLSENPEFLDKGTPAEVLALLLDRPTLEPQLALYMSRISSANSSLIARVQGDSRADGKEDLLAYVLGHVLVNSVLRYPGPILSIEALAAYLATTPEEVRSNLDVFDEAAYEGPFASGSAYYWRSIVDDILACHQGKVGQEEVETVGEYNRSLFCAATGREAARHVCDRCDGQNGGYLCPLTNRPVCDRADCSVAANSWIPAGADICRIEREFYDEWSPLLGL